MRSLGRLFFSDALRARARTLATVAVGAVIFVGTDVRPVPRAAAAERRNPGERVARSASELPMPCRSSHLQRKFDQGYEKGLRTADRTWRQRGGCGRIEAFSDAIIGRSELQLDRGESQSENRWCKFAGAVEGVYGFIEQQEDACHGECMHTGTVVGTIAAKTYCDLMIDAGGALDPVPWIRRPVGFCGVRFQSLCDVTFGTTSRAYASGTGSCADYTRDPYTHVWDQSRLRACDFHERRGQ
jgi:hypothetical protein